MLNTHPDTIFTVLTGEGRFFSAGADVKGIAGVNVCFRASLIDVKASADRNAQDGDANASDAEKKLGLIGRFSYGVLSSHARLKGSGDMDVWLTRG